MYVSYDYELVPSADLHVPDAGNCYVVMNTDQNVQMYFATKTVRGFTRIFTYGPVIPGQQALIKDYHAKIVQIEYNVAKIKKALDSMLNNNPKLKFTQARVIEEEEFMNNFIHPFNFFRSEEEPDDTDRDESDYEEFDDDE